MSSGEPERSGLALDDGDGQSDIPSPNGKSPLERRRVDAPRLPAVHTRISLSNSARVDPSDPHLYPDSLSHSRTRSISSPLKPPLLSPSFSHPHLQIPTPGAPSPTSFAFPTSPSSPQLTSPSTNGLVHPPPSRRRGHHRIHSRNLSVFFPRPDSLPPTTIHEDGAEDVLAIESAGTTIPTDGLSTTPSGQLTAGFKFGSRPPDSTPSTPLQPAGPTARRGHHHKHSLSHNFFSFLEPGSQQSTDLHTQPTPVPVSPWAPISPFPQSAAPHKAGFSPIERTGVAHSAESPTHRKSIVPSTSGAFPPFAVACAVSQFFLGAWLWLRGQHITSLACMGLGYWVVFDAMGVAVASILPQWLAAQRSTKKSPVQRFYG